MPVLLLCTGDTAAKQLLRNAIEARYGRTPPAIESLQLTFQGRTRVKLGFVKTWLPVVATAWYQFPTQARWDFTVQPLGLPVQRGVEAYDGILHRSARGGNAPAEITQAEVLETARRRLWAMAAMLLTPLSDDFIRLTYHDTYQFEAENTRLHDSVMLRLRPDYSLAWVSVVCTNPETKRTETLSLQLAETLCPLDGLMLPQKMTSLWEDEISFEVTPVTATINPALAAGIFSLTAEMAN
jgi:hypothetical protein